MAAQSKIITRSLIAFSVLVFISAAGFFLYQIISTEKNTNSQRYVPVQINKDKNTQATDVIPTAVGQCSKTKVLKIGTRLIDGVTGKSIAGSGSQIEYTNGGSQVSYDTIKEIEDSRIGDEVTVCLVSIPANCPPGDNRGKIYSAVNARTGGRWQLPDSEHSCGGA